MGDSEKQDRAIDQWLKQVTFPKGKPSPGQATLDLFHDPSLANFLNLLDATSVDGVEKAIKRAYSSAIAQSKDHVQKTESDPLVRDAALANLSRMDELMKSRTSQRFKDIFSITDLGKLIEPLPSQALKIESAKDQKDDELVLTEPPPDWIKETNYRFFNKSGATLKVGGLEDAFRHRDIKRLYLDTVELKFRILETKTKAVPPDEKPKTPPTDDKPSRDNLPEKGAMGQKSSLDLDLSAHKLFERSGKDKPYLEMKLDYRLDLGGKKPLIILGTDDRFGGKDRQLMLQFGIEF